MKKLLIVTVVLEVITSVALMIDPVFVSRLLFSVELSKGGIALGRIAAIALFSLGLACWPGATASLANASRGMFCYNLLATLCLAYLWIGEKMVGIFLIPAIVAHLVVSVIFVMFWFKDSTA